MSYEIISLFYAVRKSKESYLTPILMHLLAGHENEPSFAFVLQELE